MAALNKYYRPVSYNEYMDEWDIPMTNNAIQVAQFPEHISTWIWETERKPFEVF